jgi:hypothetical protein
MEFCWFQRGNKTVDGMENEGLVSHDGLNGSKGVGGWDMDSIVMKSVNFDDLGPEDCAMLIDNCLCIYIWVFSEIFVRCCGRARSRCTMRLMFRVTFEMHVRYEQTSRRQPYRLLHLEKGDDLKVCCRRKILYTSNNSQAINVHSRKGIGRGCKLNSST